MRTTPLVLIIDDDKDVTQIASTMLTNAGFEVRAVNSSLDAEAQVEMIAPDLIILDVNMPGLNGTQLLLDFRKNPKLKNTKVAIFTNLIAPWPGSSGDNQKMAQELGATTFIDKTKDLDHLAERVKEILNS